MDSIYLDHNATTPLLPEVAAAMAECYRNDYANPGSQHSAGRRARRVLEDAREGLAFLLGADLNSGQPDQLIFTSGGTEANNLAIFGLTAGCLSRVIAARFEHPSVIGPIEQLVKRGWQVQWIRVMGDGLVDVEHAKELIAESGSQISNLESQIPYSKSHLSTLHSSLFTLMLGNNETGVLQPVEQFAGHCRAAGIPVHCDAVQVAGKLPIDFRRLGVDTLSIAAHKFHGPRGIGALVVRNGTTLAPRTFGGFQEGGLRPGTESVALAVGMHRALRLWHEEQAVRIARMTDLREQLESSLLTAWPNIVVHGRHAPRLPHTSNISFPGLNRQALLMALDLAGVACSTGSACASGSTDPSQALVAMGCENALLESSLRFSWGAATTAADMARAVDRILMACKHLQNREFTRNLPVAGRFPG